MEVLSIAEQLLFTTVRVETVDADLIRRVGTSFIFNYKSDDKPYLFLVTNKHVIAGAQSGILTFTRWHKGKPLFGIGYREIIEGFEDIWFGHPKPNIDVTVTPFAPIENRIKKEGVDIFYRRIQNELVPSADALKKVDAIEELVFIGYPIGIWDAKNLLPVVRKGITASPIAVDFQGEPQFLIDASIFPGSSGSPVFLYNPGMHAVKTGGTVVGTRLFFLGILASVFFQKDINEIRIRSVPMVDVPVAVSKQMIDLGIVFKASTIIETIEIFLRERGESTT
jgi:hypothetical protein